MALLNLIFLAEIAHFGPEMIPVLWTHSCRFRMFCLMFWMSFRETGVAVTATPMGGFCESGGVTFAFLEGTSGAILVGVWLFCS